MLAECEVQVPELNAIAPVLWQVILAYGSFPFPHDRDDARLSWEAYLHAFTLLSPRGRSRLDETGIARARDGPHGRVIISRRRRQLHDRLQIILRAVSTVPANHQHCTASRPFGVVRDAIDAMAVAMYVDDGKQVYYDEDFMNAINQLQVHDDESQDLHGSDLEVLAKLLTTFAAPDSESTSTAQQLFAKMDPRLDSKGHTVSWRSVLQVIATNMVCAPALTGTSYLLFAQPLVEETICLYLFQLLANNNPGYEVGSKHLLEQHVRKERNLTNSCER